MSDCLFCKIVQGDIPATVLFEDDRCIAIRDVNPQAPVHALVIPKAHLTDLRDIDGPHKELMGHLVEVLNGVARDQRLVHYRTVINTGHEAGQSVFHLHLHLLGGRTMGWPPG